MTQLPPLPIPDRSVSAPESFAVSSLGRAVECSHSVAFDAHRPGTPLPTHPRAVYGRLLHQLVESAVRGGVDDSVGFSRGAREVLADSVRSLPHETPPPALVFGGVEWRRRVADAIATARVHAQPSGSPRLDSPKAAPTGVSPLESGRDGRWTEVSLASARLRLRGRADLVERSGRTVRVTDVKTGAGATVDGAVSPHVALQLRAYGLVVAELVPDAHVELHVESRVTRTVPFSAEDRVATERAVRSLADRLPRGAHVDVQALAEPGPACRLCNWRHRCRAYRDVAPSWWVNGADHPIPPDVWGTVVDVIPTVGSARIVVLHDASGRHVRIAGLRPAFARGLRSGDQIHAFGLSEPSGRWYSGRRLAPLAYHDRDFDSDVEAWSLAVYGQPSSALLRDSP